MSHLNNGGPLQHAPSTFYLNKHFFFSFSFRVSDVVKLYQIRVPRIILVQNRVYIYIL